MYIIFNITFPSLYYTTTKQEHVCMYYIVVSFTELNPQIRLYTKYIQLQPILYFIYTIIITKLFIFVCIPLRIYVNSYNLYTPFKKDPRRISLYWVGGKLLQRESNTKPFLYKICPFSFTNNISVYLSYYMYTVFWVHIETKGKVVRTEMRAHLLNSLMGCWKQWLYILYKWFSYRGVAEITYLGLHIDYCSGKWCLFVFP